MTSIVRSISCACLGVAFTLVPAKPMSAQGTSPAPVPQPDTSYVVYDEGPITLPLGIGFRLPAYNRVDGVVLPWGPLIQLDGERIRIDPTVTYRSHIGKFDPFVKVALGAPPGFELDLAGGRSTFTNDDWIRSDIVNTLTALAVGSDSRNYFRADRGTISLSRDYLSTSLILTPSIGAQTENDWSTGVPVRHSNAPWSLLSRDDTLKTRRINPAIAPGHVSSGLAGLRAQYETEEVKGRFDGRLEYGFDAPSTSFGSHRNVSGDFAQITLDGDVIFPTFKTQKFEFRGHAVVTPGDIAPPQRYAYLGGAGTLATVDLLALGGDRLFYASGEYLIPIDRIVLPFVGSPIIGLRYSAGSAGVGELPDFIQNLGVSAGIRFLKVEYWIDPNYKRTSFTRKNAFSISLSIAL